MRTCSEGLLPAHLVFWEMSQKQQKQYLAACAWGYKLWLIGFHLER